MDSKKRNMIIGIAIAAFVLVLGTIVCFRIFRGFNAEKYVNAVLSQTMKGDVKAATGMTKGLTEKEAEAQYDLFVTGFVQNVIANGLTLTEEQEKSCVDVCKKMFDKMQYEVQDSEKVSDGEYRVTVQLKKSDVLTKLQALASAEKERIDGQVEDGEQYRGTFEEIEQQMQKDFAEKLSAMLEEAYKTMEFGEAETVVLTVKKGENGLYALDSKELSNFVVKIVGLSTNQD